MSEEVDFKKLEKEIIIYFSKNPVFYSISDRDKTVNFINSFVAKKIEEALEKGRDEVLTKLWLSSKDSFNRLIEEYPELEKQ